MRIIHFSRDYTTHDHRFLSALAKTDHEILYLQLEKGNQPYEERPLPPEVVKIPWKGGNRLARIGHGPGLLKDLRRVLRTYKPNIVQAGPLQRCAFLLGLVGFRRLVSMSWGYDLLHDARRNRWWAWATRFTLKRSSAMVGDCQTIRDLAVQYGMAPDRIVTFPWGADIRKFSPPKNGTSNPIRARKGWGEEMFVLLSTRSWTSLYGVEDLARAFVAAIRKRPNLRLLMLGGGPQSRIIKEIFIRGGVAEYVHFPGMIRQNDLPEYYRAADLYISTSHSDGTSISLLEALASGCPVLVTDIPGNKEWVKPGEVGWLFSDGNVESLENAIHHAVDNRNKLRDMTIAARKLAEERADWRKNFPKLLRAYEIAQR
jgi:glycosyltransferase involved in cell wall biosynthesis